MFTSTHAWGNRTCSTHGCYSIPTNVLLWTHTVGLMRAIVTPAIPTRLWHVSAVAIIGADVGRGGSHFAVPGLVERFSLSSVHLILTGKVKRWFHILHELVQPRDPASGNLESVILIGESSIDFEACRIFYRHHSSLPCSKYWNWQEP